jgi:hypothetical protein
MPIRRIFAQASAAIVSVVFAITAQCPYASGIEFQRNHAVRDDVQVAKTHAPSSSEILFANGSRSRSFNNVASPSITKNLTGLSTVGIEWRQQNNVTAPIDSSPVSQQWLMERMDSAGSCQR